MKPTCPATTVAVLFMVICFAHSGCVKNGDQSAPSAAVVKLTPSDAAPGMTIRVTTDKPVFDAKEAPLVQIGKRDAKIIDIVSPTEAVVMVPNLGSGETEVAIVEINQGPGRAARLNVGEGLSMRLLLTMENDRIKLINAEPRGGGFIEGARPSGPRLSYDIVSDRGELIFTGAIPHPLLSGMELHDEPQPGQRTMRHEGHTHPAVTFVMKTPNLKNMTVRFYEASESIDLATKAGRDARIFINEIKITE